MAAGDVERLFRGHRAAVWDDKNALEMDTGDDCTALRMNLTPLNYTFKNG